MSQLAPDKEDQATELQVLFNCSSTAYCTMHMYKNQSTDAAPWGYKWTYGWYGRYGAPYCANNISLPRLQGMRLKSGARRKKESSVIYIQILCLFEDPLLAKSSLSNV